MARLLHLETPGRFIRLAPHHTRNNQDRRTTRCRQTEACHSLSLGREKEGHCFVYRTSDRISLDRSTAAEWSGQNSKGICGSIRSSRTQQVVAGALCQLTKIRLLFHFVGEFLGLAQVFGVWQRQQYPSFFIDH